MTPMLLAAMMIPDAPRVPAPLFHGRGFAQARQIDGAPEGWETWSPRAEIAPHFSVDARAAKGGALRVDSGPSEAACGAWRRQIGRIIPGRAYRFSALCKTQGVAYPRRSVLARLDWLDSRGERVRPPDFVLDTADAGEWRRLEHIARAPEGAASVRVELGLAWAPGGTVWFDEILLREESARPDRVIRAATVFLRPRDTKSAAESVEQFCRLLETSAQGADIICLPEGITVVGNGKTYTEVAESIPGPTTERLGKLARSLHSYVAAGIYERSGPVVYNTAVLLGRDGEVVGTYRKTHLPREEVEGGLTPGDSYPVFQTDFGKVGLMICWDVQFPEPCRALAAQGAEVILLPIWGGNEILARARAIENHVFLISSSYDMKTFIVDPTGEILAEAASDRPVARAELHLDRKILQPWLGDMKTRTWKERRPDIRVN